MKQRVSRQVKAKTFTTETIRLIEERDRQCIFCASGRWEGGNSLEISIRDIAHIINKSQGGLGIPTNGVLSCRFHHGLLDNGNKGLRTELLEFAENHLKEVYPGWNREDQYYRKYSF